MINQQLIDFIKNQLQKGVTRDVISKQLLSNGWTSLDVEEGFSEVYKITQTVPAPSITPETINNISNIITPVTNIPNSTVLPVQENVIVAKKKSPMVKILLTTLILFLVGFSIFYFKDDILNISFVKNLIQNNTQEEVIPVETPVKTSIQNTLNINTISDNFSKLNSFTFSGSESGKATLGMTPNNFSGSFSKEESGTKCSIIRSISEGKNIATVEYRIVNGVTYEYVQGFNSKIDSKWTLPEGREDLVLFHTQYPLRDSDKICEGRLPVISLFDLGEVVSSENTESTYKLIPNKAFQDVYSSGITIKDTPGGKQDFSGLMVIDNEKMLPKKITISSSAFPDPVFIFEVTSTNIPVDIQVLPVFQELQKSKQDALDKQKQAYEEQLDVEKQNIIEGSKMENFSIITKPATKITSESAWMNFSIKNIKGKIPPVGEPGFYLGTSKSNMVYSSALNCISGNANNIYKSISRTSSAICSDGRASLIPKTTYYFQGAFDFRTAEQLLANEDDETGIKKSDVILSFTTL